MLKIHDIKSLEQIPDYSIYIYYLLIVVAIFASLVLVYFVYKFFTKDKNSIEKQYYKILKNIDFDNSKQAAYDICKYGKLLAKTQREKTLINDIYHDLEEYKYKKTVDKKISKKIKIKFETFMESLDVK